MQLIYSTRDLPSADRLSQLLADGGIATHVSNVHSAQMPGISARLTPGFIGVWLVNPSDLATAHHIMQANGYIAAAPRVPRKDIVRRSSWLVLAIAAFTALAVVALSSSGA